MPTLTRRTLTRRFASAKVPEITALFWIVKILTTGMGESASDWLIVQFDPVTVVLVTAVCLAVCLAVQLSAPRYRPWRYWLLVAMIGVFGTMVADVAHIVVGVPYGVSTGIFAVALAVILFSWWRTEGTLSIHTITTLRRELYYWATVSATFALGTAVGDFAAHSLTLGYLGSGVLFAVLFALPAVAYRFAGLGAVAAFWSAYIVTRPLGASFADFLAVEPNRGGLGYGTGEVSLIALAAIVVLVAVMGRRHARSTDAVAPPLAPAPRSGSGRTPEPPLALQ